MYGNTPFDGSAAFSGGGFMPSQATQTADTSITPAKSREAQGLLPLTVKQISEAFQASDDKANFLIDGVDVNNVKLVGLLFEKTERVTDVAFVLDDGTGRIDCHRWINEPLDSREMEPLSDGMYVKVHGHLKGFQGKKQLMIYSVRRVTDYNEIPNHFADCMYVHCYNTRTRKVQGTPQVTGQMPNSAVNTPSKGYQPTSSGHFSVQYNKEGIKGVDKLILDYLQQPSCVLVLIIELPLPQRKEWEGSPMQNREPCPDRIIDDLGGAFAMDSIGGAAYHFCKGLKSSPRGERFVGGIQAVPPKSAAASASGAASSPPLTAPSSSSATRRTPGTPSSPSPVPAASSACARA